MRLLPILALASLWPVAGCARNEEAPVTAPKGAPKMEITSTAFAAGQPIPAVHTCEGQDVSPPLAWSGTPPGTNGFALICDDPDAPSGTWVHWVLFGLAPATRRL